MEIVQRFRDYLPRTAEKMYNIVRVVGLTPQSYVVRKLTTLLKDAASFLYRAIPSGIANGYGTIEKIEGNTLVWNQLVLNGDFSNGTTGYAFENSSGSTSNNELNISIPAGSVPRIKNTSLNITAEHTYYITEKASCTSSSGRMAIQVLSGGSWVTAYQAYFSSTYTTYSGLFTVPSTVDGVVFSVYRSNANTTDTSAKISNINVIDLTQMFGAGNEPSTVEGFEALYPLDYYDYNTGQLIANSMSGVRTYDSNNVQLDSKSIDVTTITGINSATNVREACFPNGMNKLDGNIDEINGDTATRKNNLYVLDGTENWETVPTSGGVTLVGVHRIPSRIPTDIIDMVGDSISLCSHYSVTPVRSGIAASLTDRHFGWNTSYYLHVKDERFLDATAFKAYLAGQYAAGTPVTLVYPITPITYTDLQDANSNPLVLPKYEAENGGTEQILPVGTASSVIAPPTLEIVYNKPQS